MKRVPFLLLICATLMTCTKSSVEPNAADKTFIKLLGNIEDNYTATDMAIDAEGNFVGIGKVEIKRNANNTKILFFKTDNKGDTLWTKQYDGQTSSEFVINPEGGYTILGRIKTNNTTNMLLIKIDAKGEIIWQRQIRPTTLTNNDNIEATSLQMDKDGNYFVLGTANFISQNRADVYLAKLNNNGQLTNEKFFGYLDKDTQAGIAKVLPNGDVIFNWSGALNNVTGNPIGMFATLVNNNTDLKWSFGYSSELFPQGTVEVSDIALAPSGFIMLGTLYVQTEGYAFVVKISSNGQLEWRKTIDKTLNQVGYAINPTQDGGYILVGNNNGNGKNPPNHDAWIFKLSNRGDTQWERNIGGDKNDEGISIKQTANANYILLLNLGYQDNKMIGLVRLNSNGEI